MSAGIKPPDLRSTEYAKHKRGQRGSPPPKNGITADAATIITDGAKSMSAVDVAGERIDITEAEDDTLTVAGAVDDHLHLKDRDGDSVI